MAKKIKTVIKLQIPGGKANHCSSSLRSSFKPLGLNNSATVNHGFPTPSWSRIGVRKYRIYGQEN